MISIAHVDAVNMKYNTSLYYEYYAASIYLYVYTLIPSIIVTTPTSTSCILVQLPIDPPNAPLDHHKVLLPTPLIHTSPSSPRHHSS